MLIDLYMSDVPGMKLLEGTLKKNPETIVIIMTGNPSVATSVKALRAGAWDYLPKPFSATQLEILVGRAAHAVLVARESKQLHEATARQHGHSEKVTVLGAAPSFRRSIDLARKVARTDASVFIHGESGTGKELIAQFIHHHSRRSSRPLVAINCAALPETLLESEMFGHRKGAFTGAVRDKPGLLETANGGTMFLDEVTEMSKPIQAKLLRIHRRPPSRASSARTSITASAWFPFTCRLCGSASKTFHSWPTISCGITGVAIAMPGSPCRRWRTPRSAPWEAIPGGGTSASCRTSSSTRWSWLTPAARAGGVRAPLPHQLGQPREREHVQGGAHRRGGSHHALPPHGEARAPARDHHGRERLIAAIDRGV